MSASSPQSHRFSVEVWKGGKHVHDLEVVAYDQRHAHSIARDYEPRATLGVVRNLGPVEDE